MSTPHGEVVTRRTMIEVDVVLRYAPQVRSSGVGDLMQPHRVTLRFHVRGDGSAGDMRYPLTVVGPAVSARNGAPDARHVTYTTAGGTPEWLALIVKWTRGQVVS